MTPTSTTKTSIYDGKNLVSEVTATDYTGDGVIDQITTMSAAFDHRGNMTAQTWIRDYNADGIPDASDEWTWTFDNKGNQTEVTLASDFNFDGVIDYSYVGNTTYNRNGDVLTDVYTYSWGRTDTTWNEYDKKGFLLASYTDLGTDGTIEHQTLHEYPAS